MHNPSANPGLDLDSFLDHSTGSKGSGVFLRKWTQEEPNKITIWLHTRATFIPRWSHNIPRVVTRTDRDTQEVKQEVWFGSFVCWEKEFVLKKQFYRDADGEREYPPEICPMCKLVEFVHLAIKRGDLLWTDPFLQFVGDDPSKTKILHAGGLANHFREPRKTPFTKEQKTELREAGIQIGEAWRENAYSRCQYVFSVVDNAHPENGCQATTEAEALGNAMKAKIKDQMEALGRDAGNPLKNPVAFLWEYDETKNFDKRYRVVAMPLIPLTDDIKELIVDNDPPDLTEYMTPGNVQALRAQLEAACLIDGVPWDDIFGAAEKKAAEIEARKKAIENGEAVEEETPPAAPKPLERKALGAAKQPEPKPIERKSIGGAKAPAPATTPAAAPAAAPATSSKTSKLSPKVPAAAPASEPAAEEEEIGCDNCDAPMKPTDVACAKCGTTYDLDSGQVTARPCAKCRKLIDIEGNTDPKVICPKCGSIHVVETWVIEVPPPPAASTKAAPKRRSLAKGAAAPAPAAADEVPFAGDPDSPLGNAAEDQLPWGKDKES